MATNPRGSKSFQTKFMVDGVLYRETFATEAEGEAWEHDSRAALMRGEGVPKPKHKMNAGSASASKERTLGAVCDHLLKHHWGVTFQRSLQVNRSSCNTLYRFFGREVDIAKLTKVMLDEMTTQLRDEGCANETINRKLATLSVAFGHAESMGYIDRPPRIPYMKAGKRRERTVTEDEETRIVEWFRMAGHHVMAEFVTFQIETGLRPSETLRAEWDHFDPDLGGLTVIGGVEVGKTEAAERYVPLSPSAQDAVRRLKLSYRGLKGPFWHMHADSKADLRMSYATAIKPWTEMREALNLPDVIIYSMRHTCATRLCRDLKSADDTRLTQVKEWMGHSNITMTQRYIHPDRSDMRDLMLRREAAKGLLRARLRVV